MIEIDESNNQGSKNTRRSLARKESILKAEEALTDQDPNQSTSGLMSRDQNQSSSTRPKSKVDFLDELNFDDLGIDDGCSSSGQASDSEEDDV